MSKTLRAERTEELRPIRKSSSVRRAERTCVDCDETMRNCNALYISNPAKWVEVHYYVDLELEPNV